MLLALSWKDVCTTNNIDDVAVALCNDDVHNVGVSVQRVNDTTTAKSQSSQNFATSSFMSLVAVGWLARIFADSTAKMTCVVDGGKTVWVKGFS